MGLNLGFIGKKLSDYEGDVGRFFGGAAQGLGNVANATGQAVGNAVLHAPVVSQAVQFGQQAATPQFQQQGLPGQVADFTKGIFSTGYNNSPLGALERTGANIASTVTQRPVVSLQGTTLPVNQQIAQAKPLFGNKLAGQIAAGAGIAGDAAYGAAGLAPHIAPVDNSLPAPTAVTTKITPPASAPAVSLKSALSDQSGFIGQKRVGGKFAPGQQVHPDDLQVMNNFIDHARGVSNLDPQAAQQLELDASRVAEHYGIGKPGVQTMGQLAGAFDKHITTTPGLLDRLKAPLQNQSGYLGSLTPDEESMGKALGMSDEETQAAKAGTLKTMGPTAPLEAKVADAQAVKTAENTAVRNEIARRATGENNPMKVSIPKVAAGDFAKARSNSQLASNPVEVAGGLAIDATKKLAPEDKKMFWQAIEQPELVRGAKDPAKLQAAVDAWKEVSDRSHAVDRALGGETPYRQTYAIHDWNLTPEEAQALSNSQADPASFQGVNNIARIHPTIQHGLEAGLRLKDRNPEEAMADYVRGVSGALKRQALVKGITEADQGNKLNRSFDLRNGKTLPVSEQGLKELRSMESPPEMGTPRKVYRAANKQLKQTLLSISQFHPVNISVLKAGPSLTGAGHPVLAAKGVTNTFLAISKRYSEGLQHTALKDGTIEAGARIGSPIKFGSDYAPGGKLQLGKNGIGERTIFEQQMPAMHIQMVRGVMKDLQSRGISLDSPEARAAGTRINEIMGFVNTEVRGLDPRVQRGLSDALLAPQFTRSKWATLKGVATDKGVARKYATSAVVGNTAALLGVQFALGSLFGQKQDNIRDTLIRALIHPSIATPFKDHKGNTVEFGLPSSYISEAAALGVNLTRGQDGRLGVQVKPANIPGNIASYGRNRLAVLPSDALKVATNTDYSNKPLYDPTASAGTKATQAATTLISGSLPIGAQGVAQAVKPLLPKASQDILNANDSGLNPLLKSAGGAFGLSARTDKTVGPALATQQYFEARNDALGKLNANDQAAYNTIHPAQKNPVTGQYQVQPTVWDTQARASVYLSHPNVLKADNQVNQALAAKGQKVDPFFLAPSDQQQKFLAYTTLNQQDPQKTQMVTQNPWITQLQQKRSQFFSSLPAGDPNKPKDPVAYPTASAPVVASQNQYFQLTEPSQRAVFIKNHPDLAAQFAAEDNYNRTVRGVKNLPQYDKYPTATPAVQNLLDQMNATTDSKARSALIRNNPALSQYLTDASVYGLEKSAGQAAFEGQGFDQKGLKDIYNLGNYNISKQLMNNGTTQYALAGTPGYAAGATASASSYAKRSSAGGRATARFARSTIKRAGRSKGGKIGKVSIKRSSSPKIARSGVSKPKVSLKSSMV